jgi:hypothetical protein
MMTFAEFQATREACADLGAKLKDGHWDDGPPATGFVYLDALWIEDVPEHWPEAARIEGRYYLQIENCEYFADQLELLECRLYVWAVDSGYCDAAPKAEEPS